MTRWWEDVVVDELFPLGRHEFTAEEIIEFARRYDPQYFHIDADHAAHSQFEGLIASGWHTASVGHRKFVDGLFAEAGRLRDIGEEPGVPGPSPGVNSIEFPVSVRPGDVLDYALVVESKRPSRSFPGWGLTQSRITATNQNGEIVYRALLVGFSKMRNFKPNLGQRIMLALIDLPVIGPALLRARKPRR
jgi:acyl dehydratase